MEKRWKISALFITVIMLTSFFCTMMPVRAGVGDVYPSQQRPNDFEVFLANSTGYINMTFRVNTTSGTINSTNATGLWCNWTYTNTSEVIQAAIGNISAQNNTIIVGNGTYNGTILVDTTANMTSDNGSDVTIIDALGDHGFNVTQNYVNISGFTVKNATGSGKSGIYLNSANNSNIFDNNVSSNSYGFNLSSSSNCALTNNTAKNNTEWDFYSDENSHNNTVENLSIGINYPTNISFTYDNGIKVKGNETAPPRPDGRCSGKRLIGKYVNATNVTVNSWLFLNMSYTGADLAGVNVTDSTMKMYKWNGTAWSGVPGSAVNETGNYVYANITDFTSTFAPAGDPPVVINEIMYNPPTDIGDDTKYEWVELHNTNTTASINVSNWKLYTNNKSSSCTIPANTFIDAGGYLVIARDKVAFEEYYHHVNKSLVVGGTMVLTNDVRFIVLKNSTGAEIDNVTYDPNWGGKDGYTLERNVEWNQSYSYSGTPLDTNSISDPEPVIVDYEPHDTNLTNYACENITFRVKANQTVNVTWYINGSVVHTNTSIAAYTWADYFNGSARIGYWNVTAIVNNTNGSDIMTWMWTVEDPVEIRDKDNQTWTNPNWTFSGESAERYVKPSTASWPQNESTGTPMFCVYNRGNATVTVFIYSTNFNGGFNPNATEWINASYDYNYAGTPAIEYNKRVSNRNETAGTWFNFTLAAHTAKEVYLKLDLIAGQGEYSATLTATNSTEVS